MLGTVWWLIYSPCKELWLRRLVMVCVQPLWKSFFELRTEHAILWKLFLAQKFFEGVDETESAFWKHLPPLSTMHLFFLHGTCKTELLDADGQLEAGHTGWALDPYHLRRMEMDDLNFSPSRNLARTILTGGRLEQWLLNSGWLMINRGF